jgi:hypothetical protein
LIQWKTFESREGSEGAIEKGELGRGSEGRARNDADTTLHLIPSLPSKRDSVEVI